MAERLGVGIVGAGFVGRFHIRSWVGVRNADILGVTSRTEAKAGEAAKLARDLGVGNARAYASVSAMVKDSGVQAVWICAPNHVRLEVMEEIARAGKGKLLGIACEKPLARNVREARRMVELVRELGIPHGYLENQLFMPSVARGKEILWRRGAAAAGRPYLARAAEEHGGPHEAWFWSGKSQGGGVLSDMMCHSLETARFLLQDPAKPRSSLVPRTVSADIATLKWSRKEYAERLRRTHGVDYLRAPAEDFARAAVTWETDEGDIVVTEATTSWSFVGPGLRLSIEVMGPEYSLQGNSLNNHLQVFFSREVAGRAGEDIVEKQTAEQGLMPVVPDEEGEYGYTAENRHMVNSFLAGASPIETFDDGLAVTKLLMACYMSAERGERLAWEPRGLDDYVPPVARETYRREDAWKGH
ncbi:MAG: Gfo/Idh/MocA family oxidoreductase [Planctomycetes bacterium]|nr:Gfo/Idh/MocA family oxidoreductase [Planctomycetota bacterium]